MNIQELHNKLVKKASMQKVAGPRADQLRSTIAQINKLRGDKGFVSEMNKVFRHRDAPEALVDSLAPYIFENKYLDTPSVLQALKTSDIKSIDNKYIDRLHRALEYRLNGIRTGVPNSLLGRVAANAVDENIINRYLKDIV